MGISGLRLLRMYRTYAQIPNNVSLTRYLMLKPFVFETITMVMQLRDFKRRAKIQQTHIADPYLKEVIAYNAGVTKSAFTRTRRAEKCYVELTYPYARLPYLTGGCTDTQMMGKKLEDEQLLIIGPRNIHELLLAWMYGYKWPNIHAIDLYSTNRKIKIMNMNAMDYEAESFDAVAVHSTLAYSADIRKSLSEIWRVLKPSGRLVFQIGHTTPQDNERFARVSIRGEEIRHVLKKLGFSIRAFRTTYVADLGTKTNGTDYFFSVQKTNPKDLGFDVIDW